MRMFRCDGRYYAIESVRGEGLRVVEATPAEVQEYTERREDIRSIALPMERIYACFVGPMLHRGQHIASLGSTRFSVLFGTGGRDSLYDHGAFLRRVGRAIPAPEPPPRGGCGKCAELVSACGAGCSRRIVHDALTHATFAMLNAAAQHTNPIAQLEAALQVRMDSMCAAKKRIPRAPRVERGSRRGYG